MRGIRARAAAALACLGAWAGCSFRSPDASPDDAAPVDVVPDVPPACLADPTYVPNAATGRRYKAWQMNVNYDASIDQCTADGAHLAVVDDAVENVYLAGLLVSGEAWIGYDDLTESTAFKWITGAPGWYGYTGGEPNDNNNEDCTALRSNGTWHDAGCEDARHPICECDPAYHPKPTPICRTMTANSFEESGRRVFRGPDVTWAQADAACKAIGAHLLVIGDAAENAEMDEMLGPDTWIGYTDIDLDGTFRWVNGSPSAYRNWSGGGIPQNEDADCAVLQDGGLWDDVECDDTHPYACECDPAPP
jgi:hypothetical protein